MIIFVYSNTRVNIIQYIIQKIHKIRDFFYSYSANHFFQIGFTSIQIFRIFSIFQESFAKIGISNLIARSGKYRIYYLTDNQII